MTKTVFSIIRSGATRDQLVAKMKPQLTLITFRKFEDFVDNLVAHAIKEV